MPFSEIVLVFRGDEPDVGVRMTSGRIQHDGSSSIVLRTMSDVLIGHSTLPGFSSNRDIYLGTWYIQAICEVFMEHACDTDIEDMLKMVSLLSLFYSFTELTAHYNTSRTSDT
jgi:caspase-like apoptosis-related cysteine protease